MKKRTITNRLLDLITEADGMRYNQGRFLRMQKALKAVEKFEYNDDDLRGLSAWEKDFMRENGMKIYWDGDTRYYIFIARNLATGKKQLYAYTKKQMISPNSDSYGNGYSYENWHTFQRLYGFDCLHYERRAWKTLPPVTIW